MKLYTEEQVRKAALFSLAEDATMEKILDLLTPIELPSDEEIRERAEEGDDVDDDDDLSAADEYERGAMWLKYKILNQNK